MTPRAVRKELRHEPDLPKDVRVKDGTRLVLRRYTWLASATSLIVVVGRHARHIPYEDITMVRLLKTPARRRRKAQ